MLINKYFESLKNLGKRISDFSRTNKSALSIILILTIVATLIRSYRTIWGEDLFFFGFDDMHHIALSGFKLFPSSISSNWIDLFFNSYSDAHPPLRNLLINLVLRLGNSIYQTRLVSLIPGILTIPTMYYFGYLLASSSSSSQKYKNLIGVIFAFFASFNETLVQLSFETRPYSPMFLFQLLTIISLIKNLKSNSRFSLISFFTFSLLTILTSYSAAISIAVYWLILLVAKLRKGLQSNKILIILSTILATIMCFQALQLNKHGGFKRFTTGNEVAYLKSNYINSISEIPTKATMFFSILFRPHHSINSRKIIFLTLYLLGILILLRRKSYSILTLACAPFFLGILVAYLKLYPFTNTRHCLALIPSLLVSYSVILDLFFIKIHKYISPKILTVLMCICYLYIMGVFINPTDYHSRYIDPVGFYASSDLYEKDFKKISTLIAENYSKNKLVMFDPAIGRTFMVYEAFRQLDAVMKRVPKEEVKPVLKNDSDYCIQDWRYWHESICSNYNHDSPTHQNYKSVLSITKESSKFEFIEKIKDKGYREENLIYKDSLWLMVELSAK